MLTAVRLLFVLLATLFAAAAPAQAAEKRIALVIGNASYPQKPLKNPLNDAADLAAALRGLGFEVMERKNRNADELRRDLADFQDKLDRGSVGLFYFAGHGVQAGRGLNYLLPVGVEYKRERDAELYGLEASSVLRRMEEAGTGLSLVILDACRDSPLPAEGRSAGSRGLGRMEAPSGSLIAFATAPGSTADENAGSRNGLYTKHLLAAIQTPGLPLEAVFKRVRRGVEADTNRRQSPEELMKLTSEEPFYFKPGPRAPDNDRQAERERPATPGRSETFTVNGVSFKMVAIPAGAFLMGSPADEPERGNNEVQHRVSVKAFQLGETEVTQGLWQAVMGSNPSGFKDCGATCPVENVSWNDAQNFIRNLNQMTGQRFRLPSEAEWEYAARAGTTTPFSTGPTITPAQANFNGNDTYNGSAKGEYRGKTLPVASFAANAWGLNDMHGNVWEWVQDCYGAYGEAPSDGSAAESASCSLRVLRGGSWSVDPQGLRSAVRVRSSPVVRYIYTGFRLARTVF